MHETDGDYEYDQEDNSDDEGEYEGLLDDNGSYAEHMQDIANQREDPGRPYWQAPDSPIQHAMTEPEFQAVRETSV